MMNERWREYYQPPASPLARLGMILAGLGILALSFMLGLVVLAVAMGLALLGALVVGVRRLLGGTGAARNTPPGPIEVEYRVVHRERQERDID